jgi:antitoxin (DNA-binding transcriptional repressor) of toxin-antitoxin stability system
METIKIRDVRGKALLDRARKGEPLAITDYRVLIGVIIPAAEAWAQHLICQNWPHVQQSIAEAEAAMADGGRLTTVQDEVGPADPGADPGDDGNHRAQGGPGKPAVPLEAAIVGGVVAQTPQSREVIRRLHSAWNLQPPVGAGGDADSPSAVQDIRSVRIGDLSAAVIKEAGANREALAVTHDRELVGILVPVTQDLVQFLIEQNMSRVLANIDRGEEQLDSRARMVTLDEEIPPRPTRR